jgi:FtsZ-interacting cell division protein ZipA
MSPVLIILIAVAAVALIVLLVSAARRQKSEADRHDGKLAVEAEERHTLANDKRRRAEDLAARASEHAEKAERLDREAADELDAAHTQDELSDQARDGMRRRGRMPIRLARRS